MDIKRIQTHGLVIGGGLAGLSAAITLRSQGWDVIMVSKGKVGRSGNTILTRNSMAAVMEEGGDYGTIREHIEDTLAGGLYHNDSKLVTQMASKAREGIYQLAKWGVPFIENEGQIAVKGSPGHRRRRIVSVDSSALKSTVTAGLAISEPLLQRAKEAGVKLLDGLLITRLLKKDGRVCGALGLDRHRSQACFFDAQVVILAGGGCGQLYPLTTNAGDVTGDGYALGHQAGATICDMEFIQFHPTVTLGSCKEVLSTAPFNDGAVLRNRLGERFMEHYSPEGEMATRDIMARAVHEEITSGRGTERGGVYVDFSAVPPEKMLKEYAPIHKRLKGTTIIEIGTAAHFMMGGLRIDEQCQTGIPGLLACGEVVGGLHGANRLAGNALTEAVVFGLEAGQNAMDHVPSTVDFLDQKELEGILDEDGIQRIKDVPEMMDLTLNPETEKGELMALKKELRSQMGLHVGLVRSEQGLSQVKARLNELSNFLKDYQTLNYAELLALQQLKLMLKTALLITEAADLRKDSFGAHYRVKE